MYIYLKAKIEALEEPVVNSLTSDHCTISSYTPKKNVLFQKCNLYTYFVDFYKLPFDLEVLRE